MAKDVIPIANPMNLPGHNVPSKYSTINFVAIINEYDIGIANINATANGFFLNHGQTN